MDTQIIKIESEKDIIFIQLNEDLDYNEAVDIIKNIQNLFPKNKILAIRENSIKSLTILKNSDFPNNIFDKDNIDLTNWLNTKIEEIKL